MGIDIVKGSPLSRTSPAYYAVAILDSNGRLIYETCEAPLKRVIRLAWEYRVKRIGVDNVFELGPDTRSIAKILSLLPDDVELIQVTVEGNSFVDLRTQASRLGIDIGSKPRPLQTAYICAYLALHGIGKPIRAIEYRTKIIVSRGRSIGAGGSSANRYARSMRGAVLRMVRKIKEALDRASISYDLVFRRSRGGLDSAVFIVYAPRSALYGIVKPAKGHDVRVVIRPEYRSILLLDKEIEQKKNYVIVGIDPGIETGLAVIDLSMRPLLVASSRELDRASILTKIYSVGIPVLVATDKNPPPDTVKKIASTLGVPLYVPPKSLSVAEKESLVEWFRRRSRTDIRIETSHERDALAAAIKAYKVFERKFAEIERKVRELGIDVDIDELKTLLLKGKTVDEVIEYAVEKYLDEMYSSDRIDLEAICRSTTGEERNARVQELEKKVEELIRERELLRDEVKKLRKLVEELEFELRYRPQLNLSAEDIRDRELFELRERVKVLQNHVKELSSKLEESKKMSNELMEILDKIARGSLVAIPALRTLTLSDLRALLETSVPAIAVLENVVEPRALEYLRSRDTVVIMMKCGGDTLNHVYEYGIPATCLENTDSIKIVGNVIIVPRNVLENAIAQARQDLERYREEKKRRKELDLAKLLQIIEEYRRSLENT